MDEALAVVGSTMLGASGAVLAATGADYAGLAALVGAIVGGVATLAGLFRRNGVAVKEASSKADGAQTTATEAKTSAADANAGMLNLAVQLGTLQRRVDDLEEELKEEKGRRAMAEARAQELEKQNAALKKKIPGTKKATKRKGTR